MTQKALIERFLASKTVAVIGFSHNPQKFGHQIYNELLKRNYKVYPVNPKGGYVGEQMVFESLKEVPVKVDGVLIITPRKATRNALQDSIDCGVESIWIQQTAESEEAINLAGSEGVDVIVNKCLFMFLEPVTGVHKFHRMLMKLFGKYPS